MFGLLACFMLQSPVLLWFIMIPVSIFSGFIYPSLLALISNNVAPDQRGAAMGAASAVLALAWMLSGFLFLPALHVWVALPMVVSVVLYGLSFAFFIPLKTGIQEAVEK
jgi:MFS family permease